MVVVVLVAVIVEAVAEVVTMVVATAVVITIATVAIPIAASGNIIIFILVTLVYQALPSRSVIVYQC